MDLTFIIFRFFQKRNFKYSSQLSSNILSQSSNNQSIFYLNLRSLTELVNFDHLDYDFINNFNISQDVTPDDLSLDSVKSNFNYNSFTSGYSSSKGLLNKLHSSRPTISRSIVTSSDYTLANNDFFQRIISFFQNSSEIFNQLIIQTLSNCCCFIPISKALYEYIFTHENNVKFSLQFATFISQQIYTGDFWWKICIGRCFYLLNLFRDAELNLSEVLSINPLFIDVYILLSNLYFRLNNLQHSLRILHSGLFYLPFETAILLSIAKVNDYLKDKTDSIIKYLNVIHSDNSNIEALACISFNLFENQLELSLRYYNRLSLIGVVNSEVYANLAICSFYCQEFDLCFSCFDISLDISNNNASSDTYYNLGNIFVYIGETSLAIQCYKLSILKLKDNAKSMNNIAFALKDFLIISFMPSFVYLFNATVVDPFLYQSQHNLGYLSFIFGEMRKCFYYLNHSLLLNEKNSDSIQLVKYLSNILSNF